MLTDTDIKRMLTTSKREWDASGNRGLLVDPFNEEFLTPVGYDLRVGDCYYMMRQGKVDKVALEEGEEFEIPPREMAAVQTEEFVGMPQTREYSGLLVSKVSMGEMGLSHISTSLDHDWKDHMLVTVTNVTNRPARLHRGEAFCTMVLFRNASPATKSSGKTLAGHVVQLVTLWQALARS